MTTDREVMPCPFCGSPANDFNPDGDMEGYTISCSGKHAIFNADESCCPMHSFSYSTYEDALAAWNRRAALAAPVAGKTVSLTEAVRAALEAAAQICDAEASIEGIAQRCAERIRAAIDAQEKGE